MVERYTQGLEAARLYERYSPMTFIEKLSLGQCPSKDKFKGRGLNRLVVGSSPTRGASSNAGSPMQRRCGAFLLLLGWPVPPNDLSRPSNM